MVAGDFNNDGKQDIAVSDNTFAQTITLYLGNGDGTFTQGTTFNVSNKSGGSAVNLAAEDFKGDGNLDLVTPIYGSTSALPVYFGEGDGTFTAASGSLPATVGDADTAQIGEFNGDGLPDIYITGPTSLQNLAIYLSNGDGTFNLVPFANTPELPCCRASALADVNNDGVSDIVASDFYDSPGERLPHRSHAIDCFHKRYFRHRRVTATGLGHLMRRQHLRLKPVLRIESCQTEGISSSIASRPSSTLSSSLIRSTRAACNREPSSTLRAEEIPALEVPFSVCQFSCLPFENSM